VARLAVRRWCCLRILRGAFAENIQMGFMGRKCVAAERQEADAAASTGHQSVSSCIHCSGVFWTLGFIASSPGEFPAVVRCRSTGKGKAAEFKSCLCERDT